MQPVSFEISLSCCNLFTSLRFCTSIEYCHVYCVLHYSPLALNESYIFYEDIYRYIYFKILNSFHISRSRSSISGRCPQNYGWPSLLVTGVDWWSLVFIGALTYVCFRLDHESLGIIYSVYNSCQGNAHCKQASL